MAVKVTKGQICRHYIKNIMSLGVYTICVFMYVSLQKSSMLPLTAVQSRHSNSVAINSNIGLDGFADFVPGEVPNRAISLTCFSKTFKQLLKNCKH